MYLHVYTYMYMYMYIPAFFLKNDTALGFSLSAMYSSLFPCSDRQNDPKWTAEGSKCESYGMSKRVWLWVCSIGYSLDDTAIS